MIATLLAVTLAAAPDLKGWTLLEDASKRAFRYFVERSNPQTGFTKDRSRNFTSEDSPDHTVASVAAIGYALAAYGVGEKRGWMTRAEAVRRTRLTLHSLETLAPKHEGWFYHWLDWRSGERQWKSEVSTIDSAILWSGLIIAEEALKDPEITAETSAMFRRINWKFFLTDDGKMPNSLTICMGWHPEDGFINARWNGYFEQMMLLVMALGADANLPRTMWSAINRPVEHEYGFEYFGGGPLFIHQMSHTLIDFKGKRDFLGNDYWVSSRNITLMQRAYCKADPKRFVGYGANSWGLSACDIPGGYGAQSANTENDNGTIAPPSALASVMFTPKESIAAAEGFLSNYPNSYGRYGFSSGINPTKNWVGPDVIGIDQGQMMLAIEDARDGLPQRLFMGYPIIARGLKRIGLHRTVEGPPETRRLQQVKNIR